MWGRTLPKVVLGVVLLFVVVGVAVGFVVGAATPNRDVPASGEITPATSADHNGGSSGAPSQAVGGVLAGTAAEDSLEQEEPAARENATAPKPGAADPLVPSLDTPDDPADVVPIDPVDPPVPAVLPGAAASVACVSGDMVDIVSFEPPAQGGAVTSFALLRATSADGPFREVATAAADADGFRYSVDETAAALYTVVARGPGGEGPRSEVVDNDRVSIAAGVSALGATLRSSNGEVVLVLAPGSFDSTTTVTIDEVAGSPTGGIISLAGIYRIEPSGELDAPATLSVAYTLAVTHHQVSAALLKAACLMTYDQAADRWVPGASDVHAEAGYVTGTLGHFSEWVPGTIQPHGTNPESVDYCSGVCHDLETSAGSTLRYAARDSQVCYNCHGNPDLAAPPVGASGANVQNSFTGASIVSKHPVATGGLYCTACHNPHADPVATPGLLRAYDAVTGKAVTAGAAFCWTCHGTVASRTVNTLVPGYFTRTGGNKKTAFNGAHNAVSSNTTRLDSSEELARGFLASTQVQADGTVTIAQTPIELPKTAAVIPIPAITGDFAHSPPDPGHAYDGSVATKVFWSADAMGASADNGWIGTSSLTIDLGSMTRVTTFESYFIANTSTVPDIVEIQTSSDGVTWTSLVSQGSLGVGRPISGVTLNGDADCRYVRFVFYRDFTSAPTGLVSIAEITVRGMSSQGTFEFRPDIARKATYTGGVVRWAASVVSPATMTVTARASMNNGSTWTAWGPVVNGGALSQIPAGSSLENALLEVRATLASGGVVTPVLDWVEVTVTRGAITGATPVWTGSSPATECQRCHASHGSSAQGLLTVGSTVACTTCHVAAYGSYSGQSAFSASVHYDLECAECHGSHGKSSGSSGVYAFLLDDTRREACLSCHGVVKAAFNAAQNADSQWGKHDIYSAEQVRTGSRIACRNCHSAHSSTTGLVNPDSIGTSFETLIDDPTSIPTTEIVVYASRDTVLDSTVGQESWNYGSSSQVTITQSNRALFYFDLSTIPAGATIQNATLVLWGSNPSYTVYKGGYTVYPVTRDWLEGTGTGSVNSAAVNGATWLEPSFGAGWTTPGGDYGAAVSPTAYGIRALNITALVVSLKQGANYGIGVRPNTADTNLPMYMRETATAQYRPRLRIVYRTGPATRQVVDDITFCNKCHDGAMPLGLTGQGMTVIANSYQYQAHGGAKGLGPESSAFDFYSADAGGGGLKAPYSYGMDALLCTTCHDPHGSRLPYHLKEVVNGRDMTTVFSAGWSLSTVSEGKSLGYFCGACHVFPTNHTGYESSSMACASGCHSHGGK
jgi:predicted CXXCH cytochrome family protein